MKNSVTLILSILTSLLSLAQPEIPQIMWDRSFYGYSLSKEKVNRDSTLAIHSIPSKNTIQIVKTDQYYDTLFAVDVLEISRVDTIFKVSDITKKLDVISDTFVALMPHGKYVEFRPSSSIKYVIGEFDHGLKQGEWTFQKNGESYITVTYQNDQLIGPLRSYYAKDKIEWVGRYGLVEYKTLDYDNSFELVPNTGTKSTRVGTWTHYNIFHEVEEIVVYERK